MMNSSDKFSRKHFLWGTGIVIIALIVRLIYLFQSSSNSPFFYNPSIDALYHHLLAIDFSNGNLSITGPFFRAPLYPIFLGMIYSIFGTNLFIASFTGHLLGILIVILIYYIGVRYFDFTTGVIAAVIYIFYWPALYFEGQLLVDTLFSFLTIAAVYALIRGSRDNGNFRYIISSGILLGLAAITRANILIFYLPAVLWLQYRIRNIRKTILFLTAAVIPILPITAVNYFGGDDIVLIASQGGINFYIGNNEKSDGMTANLPEFGVTWEYNDCKFLAEKETGKKDLMPSEVSSIFYGKGLSFILNNPLEAVLLFIKKIYLSMNNFEISNNQSLYFSKQYSTAGNLLIIPFTLILGFAVPGKVISGLKRGEHLLLFLAMLSIWLTMILFFVTSRFRLPLMPYISIFAGYGISSIYLMIKNRSYKRILFGIIPGIILCALSITNITGPDRYNFAQAYYNLGNIHLRNGDWDKARVQYKEAIKADENVSLARLNLGNIRFYERDYDSAAVYYLNELRHHPGESRAYLNLSTIELLRNNYYSAIELAQSALIYKPNLIPAVVNLITSQLKSADTVSAAATANKYLKLIGPDPRLLLISGTIFQQKEQLDSAAVLYGTAIDKHAGELISNYNLGEVYSRDLPFSSNILNAQLKANYNLSIIEIQRGNYKHALNRLLDVIEADSTFVEALINIGLLYDLQRDYKTAEGYLGRALSISPEDIAAIYNLGLIFAKTGRMEKAKEYFRKALEIDPSFKPAIDKLYLIDNLQNDKN